MKVSTTLTVERDGREIEIEATGHFTQGGDPSMDDRSWSLDEWFQTPPNVDLTEVETEMIVQLLYDEVMS